MTNTPNAPDGQTPSKPSDPKKDLGFDPDSPDLEDPQTDPIGPAKIPGEDDDKS
ncbi:DUF6021 family protein [Pseudomonas sp. nanlin1]|uniref:DUF6021 family protein n=1 Tax=Pseudomonas sp. nanlin1 TaxID=3040605 RepID=UPI0038911821